MVIDPRICQVVASNMTIDPWLYYHVNTLMDPCLREARGRLLVSVSGPWTKQYVQNDMSSQEKYVKVSEVA